MKFKNRKARIDWIKKCVAKGMTYAEIGKKLGISRQRVHQLFRGYVLIIYKKQK